MSTPLPGVLIVLLLVVGCGDRSAGSGGGPSSGATPNGVIQRPTASGATTTTVAQRTTRQLPDGVLVISVLRGSGAATPTGEAEGVLFRSDTDWYFFLVRLATRQDVALPPGAREAFVTAALPSLPPNDQNQTLQRVDLKASGRSRAHRSGGVEVIVAIQGRIEVHSGTFSPTKLGAGDGAYVLDNTPLQVWSLEGQPASYLDYYLLPNGRALATDVENSP